MVMFDTPNRRFDGSVLRMVGDASLFRLAGRASGLHTGRSGH